jgi:sulfide:quinone oxidoreductase
MSNQPSNPTEKLRVLVAGGGVAAIEAILALHELAGDRVSVSVLAPNSEFVYRPMTVREPFAYSQARRYELGPIVRHAGAELIEGELGWVDRDAQVVHSSDERELPYDALLLALGARVTSRYKHCITIDDRRMDEALHGLIQDVEGGYADSIAFVAPARMAWPFPLYELALMTAGRAYDMGVKLDTTIITSEDGPLAIFGAEVSRGVKELLEEANIKMINSAYVEVPAAGELVINPGDRRMHFKRVVALPELYGPSVRGIPVSEHGFIRVNRFGRVPDAGPVYAAGDAIDFPIKQGGLGSQQADVAAESIAALAGADIDPQPFKPVIHGMLLTDDRPRYMSAKIIGGQGESSHFGENPPAGGGEQKITARYLTPYLESLDNEGGPA